MPTWTVRVATPNLTVPVRIDPAGSNGPTKAQAEGPRWRRSSPGLYVPAYVDRGIVEQRIIEEASRLAVGAVTGWASLRMHGVGYLDGLEPDGHTELAVPLAIPPGFRLRPAPTILVHCEKLPRGDITTAHGIPVTTPIRACFDAARRAPTLRAAVTVVDMSLASRAVTRASLADYLTTRRGWRGLRQVQRALDLADAGSASPQETALRLIWVLDAGLPPPRCNWPVADSGGSFIGRPDLLSTELGVVGEFDGAEHRSRARQRDDVRRDEAFRGVGLEPFRVVGADLADVPMVVRRIHAAIGRARNLTRSYLLRAQA